eukprot:2580275-Rhodomonas_salina.1
MQGADRDMCKELTERWCVLCQARAVGARREPPHRVAQGMHTACSVSLSASALPCLGDVCLESDANTAGGDGASGSI